MAKPKITRLGDPANPYTPGKVTRTGTHNKPTPAAQREAARKPAPVIVRDTAVSTPRGNMRTRQIDRIVDEAVTGKKKR